MTLGSIISTSGDSDHHGNTRPSMKWTRRKRLNAVGHRPNHFHKLKELWPIARPLWSPQILTSFHTWSARRGPLVRNRIFKKSSSFIQISISQRTHTYLQVSAVHVHHSFTDIGGNPPSQARLEKEKVFTKL